MSFPSLPLGLHLSFTFLLLSSPFLWSTKQTWLQRKKRGIFLSFRHIRFFLRIWRFSECYVRNNFGIIIPWSKKFRANCKARRFSLDTLHNSPIIDDRFWAVTLHYFQSGKRHRFNSEIIKMFKETKRRKWDYWHISDNMCSSFERSEPAMWSQ